MVLGAWLLDKGKPGAVPDSYKRTAETSVKGSTLHRRYTGGATQQKTGYCQGENRGAGG